MKHGGKIKTKTVKGWVVVLVWESVYLNLKSVSKIPRVVICTFVL